jgi:hypothetical protein
MKTDTKQCELENTLKDLKAIIKDRFFLLTYAEKVDITRELHKIVDSYNIALGNKILAKQCLVHIQLLGGK